MQIPEDSELNNIIPPEIAGDSFHAAISWLSEHEDLHTVLEIGSSAGGGSTTAFVDGLRRNPNRPILYCMELSMPRFEQLRRAYAGLDFVRCYNASSVSAEKFPTEKQVTAFYSSRRSPLNRWPLERVLGWLRQDIDYVAKSGAPQNGIQLIKAERAIDSFDMVLIDGSEFTGAAELEEIYGATIICLDDTQTFKNFCSRFRLTGDQAYELIIDDSSLRNGFSVFCRRDRPCVWRDRGMYLNARGQPAQSSRLRKLWHLVRARSQ
jgi:hypothetical protein